MLAQKPNVYDAWADSAKVVCDVWHTIRALTLHFIWTDRNRCLFNGLPPSHVQGALAIIFTTLGAHVRHAKRRRYTTEEVNQLERVLAAMKQYTPFGNFVRMRAFALEVRHH